MKNILIQTQTGYFDIARPWKYNYSIEEIAHSLSNLCRFTGQTSRFYSVLEHSLLVWELAGGCRTALLHDASEAYVGDVASPLKRIIPAYKVIEDNVQEAIASFYNLTYPFPAAVASADLYALKIERLNLLPNDKTSDVWTKFDEKFDLFDEVMLTNGQKIFEKYSNYTFDKLKTTFISASVL